MRRRLIPALLAASTLALGLAACSTADEAAPTATSGGQDDSLTSVQEAGVIVFGTEGTYRPFSYHEDGSGELTGFDVEIARAVAAELGVEAQFEETQWDAIFAGLESGRFDAIANQVSITPEREEAYTFSAPYTFSRGVVVVPEDDTSITSFADLDGKTTAQSLTSNWYTLAEESGANVEAVEGWAQAVALVQQGRVAATINDELTFLDHETQTGGDGLKVAAETEDVSRQAFAFAAGSQELADAVDEALASLAEDGTLAEISQTYFGADVTQE
ncbi:amino acid ABC transporter substrate-binding protein [Cellulomonas sp. SLBN-39]|uniref:amino acid ABC transporter substrate-binding protein n=1 Tax=Cellulomonas sp. SLBN-39 TaxID=2768446 RepID=UPI001152627A|nr:amino acid ABC transporter substrate-binding protein [Cellulomonas sp. SLBN-39]TQL01893.1 amino acid ABC transporter substrate-binding protein (PAAT family) [Cellulomonas sp. SLBN-39]